MEVWVPQQDSQTAVRVWHVAAQVFLSTLCRLSIRAIMLGWPAVLHTCMLQQPHHLLAQAADLAAVGPVDQCHLR